MKKFIMLVILGTSAALLLSRAGKEEPEHGADRPPGTGVQEETDRRQTEEKTTEPGIEHRRTLSSTTKATKKSKRDAPEVGGLPDEVLSFILPERNPKESASVLYDKARGLLEKGDLVESRRLLTEVYLTGDKNLRKKSAEAMDKINARLIFDPSYRRGATIHTVRRGETLGGHIGPKYGVNWRMLIRINNISRPEMIRENQEIKVIEGRPRLIINKSDFTLTLFIEDYYVKEYSVGLGRDGRTPTGNFSVDSMLVEADWYPPWGGVVKYGQEGHLIGTRWIGFEDRPDAAGYGIHGTSDPDSIGAMESEGCIRLTNEDVEELYDFLVSGTEVKIFD